jgi:hypothetical protein
MIDDESLENWFVCPWCRSDEPADPDNTDPEETELYVHTPDDMKGADLAVSVRCHSCGTDVSWNLSIGDEPECYAHD